MNSASALSASISSHRRQGKGSDRTGAENLGFGRGCVGSVGLGLIDLGSNLADDQGRLEGLPRSSGRDSAGRPDGWYFRKAFWTVTSSSSPGAAIRRSAVAHAIWGPVPYCAPLG